MPPASGGSEADSLVREILAGRPSAGGAPRSIRVFVSSTFQDMNAEREVLVKQVFPALRERCAARGVSIAEVDLRWGVTAEDAENGKVLEICLREIEACLPYFVALLGDRYGWVPERVDPGLRSRFAGLPELGGLSATAIEIRYGLLSTAAHRGRAAFYLRPPALPEGQRDPRQEALRAEVRASGALVRDGYASLDALAAAVTADLAAMVDADFPDAPPGDAFDAALRRQASWLLLSRPEPILDEGLLRALGDDAHATLVVAGSAGSGKSTLVRHWLRHRRARRDETVILCAIGATVPADLAAVLRFLCAALGLPRRGELPDSLDALRLMFTGLLGERRNGDRVLLVLDGLDRLPDRDGGSALTWLPEAPPPGVRVVATASPGKAAEQLAARGWPHLAPRPLDETQRERLASGYLAVYAKKPTPRQLERITGMASFATPLFAVTVLEELRVFGSFEGLDAELDRYASCASPQSLFDQVLARFERDFEAGWPGLVGACLGPLVLAREGLDETGIRRVAGGGEPVPMAHWSPFRFALRLHLAEIDGVLSIGYAPLADAIRQRYLHSPALVRAGRERLVALMQDGSDSRSVGEALWQMAQGPLPVHALAFLGDRRRFEFAAGHCWADLVQAIACWDAQLLGDFIAALADATDDWPVESLALLAQLLAEANLDSRNAERQILQADEMRAPGTLASLALLASLERHPLADAIDADIAAGRLGLWSRMHQRMVASAHAGLRIERRGGGLVARTWDAAPPTTGGAIVAEFLYAGEGHGKGWLRHAGSDPSHELAQRLLNLAGSEVGHGVVKFAVAQPYPPRTPTAAQVAKAVGIYDAAREIYLKLDALDRLAFIGARKCSLDLPPPAWAGLLAQSKRDQLRALELNRVDAATQFAFLRGQAALRAGDRDEVAGAFRSLRDALPVVVKSGDVRAHATCAALLEDLRTALRRLPANAPPTADTRPAAGLLERLKSLLKR